MDRVTITRMSRKITCSLRLSGSGEPALPFSDQMDCHLVCGRGIVYRLQHGLIIGNKTHPGLKQRAIPTLDFEQQGMAIKRCLKQ